MTIFPWKRQKTKELDKYILGKQNRTFYISVKPREPIRRSDICIFGKPECSHFSNEPNNDHGVVNRTPRTKQKAAEFTLSHFLITYRPNVYPCQMKAGRQTLSVSLYENSRFLKAEIRNHAKVYAACHSTFALVRGNDKPKCPRIGLAKPIGKIFARGLAGITDVPVGLLTRNIPPLNHQHCVSLVKVFLDHTIRERVINDPCISQVRLRVRMGEMSPANDHLNPQVLFRPVYFNQLRREAGRRIVLRWSMSMGIMLAILHWSCGLDGEGNNFLLASGKNNRPGIWATDFGDCKPIKPWRWKSRKWSSVIMNNPTWPRPAFAPNFIPSGDPNGDMGVEETWKMFVDGYKQASREILYKEGRRSELDTPRRFIDKLESAWKKRQDDSEVESLSGSSASLMNG
ncbi:hypothetical protein CEP51_009567 [Fusarium floridanum]|uniref:DUF3669 domain-containing protein n=1 Tax=Fusarium floridanum TaxID=1325733 RepID=A0A428RH84_9HYPO|nr:hypothetical protein CEP51_009567 [Fusarium floridanum]